MVEKIIINPTKVRAYGNIVNVKSDGDYEPVDCTITEDTDTVYGATVNVIVMEPDLGEATTLTVTSSSSTLVLDNTVNISATLKDSSNAAISGATITFKEGTTTLGTSTTNSSGVATYTYTGASVGDHTINAGFAGDSTYASSTGNVSVTVTDHVYSISFNQSSYVATGGSVEISCTLLRDSSPFSGATVAVTGSDSSVYTGITNSNGVASVTVTNVSAETTFTATYSNATATCTVNAVSYLFRDGGVTGDVNTDYTNLSNADISVTTDSAGTLMKCASGYGDKFRKANTLISGDFEIKYTCISATVVYGSMRFLTTSNGNMFTVEQYVENDVAITIGNSSSTYAIGETITFPLTMTIQRVNGKLAVWYNDIQVASNLTVSTNDGYFSWKFYANDRREQKVKDLTIRQL